jgi:hypothetical protein
MRWFRSFKFEWFDQLGTIYSRIMETRREWPTECYTWSLRQKSQGKVSQRARRGSDRGWVAARCRHQRRRRRTSPSSHFHILRERAVVLCFPLQKGLPSATSSLFIASAARACCLSAASPACCVPPKPATSRLLNETLE